MKTLSSVTSADVRSVYSGRHGCACGCRGQYRAHPLHRAEAERAQGYAITDGEVSEREVKRILGLVQAPGATVESDASGGWFSTETETRVYVVYLCDAARAATVAV